MPRVIKQGLMPLLNPSDSDANYWFQNRSYRWCTRIVLTFKDVVPAPRQSDVVWLGSVSVLRRRAKHVSCARASRSFTPCLRSSNVTCQIWRFVTSHERLNSWFLIFVYRIYIFFSFQNPKKKRRRSVTQSYGAVFSHE